MLHHVQRAAMRWHVTATLEHCKRGLRLEARGPPTPKRHGGAATALAPLSGEADAVVVISSHNVASCTTKDTFACEQQQFFFRFLDVSGRRTGQLCLR